MSYRYPRPEKRVPDIARRPLPGLIRASLLASAGALLGEGLLMEEAVAGPKGGKVVAGQGRIGSPNSKTTRVQQQSHSLAINWQTFNVKSDELVQFSQPSPSATVLNRVLNQSPTQIFGSVRANGQVFILNAGGVVIGQGARVNVGGLFVSSLDITDSDFMSGNYAFKAKDGEAPGAVVNRGLIQAARGGSVSLVGGRVANEGVIVADMGHVNLAAGRTATVDFNGDGMVRFEVDGQVLSNASGADAAVSNAGEIRAEGGQVMLSARAASQVFDRAVNNSGLIRAGGISKAGGKVILTGFGGGVKNTGTVDTSGASGGEVRMVSDSVIEQYGTVRADGSEGDGGRVHLASLDTTLLGGDGVTSARSDAGQGGLVEVLGNHVGLMDSARVDASGATGGGKVRVGGDFQGTNPDVRNARRTYLGEGTTITVDATDSGDGGTAIVWSDEVTRFYGHISARGGGAGGDGGFVEVSGKDTLTFAGTVDRLAPGGRAGTLLLDPKDIVVDAGGIDLVADAAAFSDPNPPGDGSASLTLDPADIQAALAGGPVVLQANNDILIQDSIPGSGTTSALTLQAGRHIIIAETPDQANPPASTSTGAVVVTLDGGDFIATINDEAVGATGQIGQRDAGAAEFFMASMSSIVTNGGSVDISSGTLDKTGGGVDATDVGAITLTTITTDGAAAVAPAVGSDAGDVTVSTLFGISVSGIISALGGDADSSGGNALGGGGGGTVMLTASDATGMISIADISTTGGAAMDNDTTGTDADGGTGGGVTLDTGGGTITLNATNIATMGGAGVGGGGLQGDGANVAVNDAALVNGAVTLNTGANGGDVTFDDTVNAFNASSGDHGITVTAGGGNVTLNGDAGTGGNGALEAGVTLSGAQVQTGAITTSSADTNQAAGNVDLDGSAALSVAGDINAVGNGSGGGGNVSVDTTAGGISVEAINASGGGGASTGGAIALNDTGGSAGTVTLNGDLITTGGMGGGAILAGTALSLGDDVTLSTGTTGGSVNLDGDVSGGQTLTLTSGGAIDLDGITVGTGGNELNAFEITGADTVVLNAVTVTGDLASDPGVGIKVRAETSITVNGVLTTQGGSGGELLVVGGGVTLNAAESLGANDIILNAGGDDVIVNADRIEPNTITILANRDILVQALVHAMGGSSDAVLTADFDGDGIGGVRVEAGGEVRAGGEVIITGSDLFATGGTVGDAVVIVADPGNNQVQAADDVTLQTSVAAPAGADIVVNGRVASTGGGLILFDADDTGGQVQLSADLDSTGGTIQFADALVLSGASVTLTADLLQFDGTVNGGGTTSLTTIATNGGSADFDDAVSNVTVLDTTGAVNVGADITTTGAQIYDGDVFASQPTMFQGSAFTLGAGGSVTTAGDDLTLTFDDVAIGDSLNAGAGIITIDTLTGGRGVDLGSGTAGKLSLTQSELANISADMLRIGEFTGPSNGGITVSAAISPGPDILALRTTGTVATTGAGAVTVADLGVDAAGAVTLDGPNNVGATSLAINAGGAISFTDGSGFRIGTVDSISGLDSSGASTTLNAGGLVDQVAAGTITASTLSIETTTGVDLTAAANNVATLEVDASGTVNYADQDGLAIGVEEVSTDSDVTITTGGAGGLTLNGDIEGDLVTLNTGGALVDNGGGQIAADELNLMAGGLVDLDDNVNGTGHSIGNLTGTSGGSLTVFNSAGIDVDFMANGGASDASVTTRTGDIAGGTLDGNNITLNAGRGISGIQVTRNGGSGTLTLSSAGSADLPGAALDTGTTGNISVTDTSGASLAMSDLTVSTNAGSTQVIRVTNAGGFDYDADIASAPAAGDLTRDRLILGGNTLLSVSPNPGSGSVLQIDGNTAVGTGTNPGGAGAMVFNGNVAGNGNDFTVDTARAIFTGNITMGAGNTLTLNSSPTRFNATTNLIADNVRFGGGPGSINGPGSLTILRASASALDTVIGDPADPQFRPANLVALAGFNGTLGIGGTRTTPPTANQLLNDIRLIGPLNVGGDVFLVGAGDVTFDTTGPNNGVINTPGTVTVVALGSSAVADSGNIVDTNDGVSASGTTPKVITANTVELLAANRIGQDGTGGDNLNVQAVTVSAAQAFEGEALVDRIGGTGVSESVLPVQAIYAVAGSGLGALTGLINTAFLSIGGTAELTTVSISTPKQAEDQIGFIDEGVFLLPPAFTSPERALLMPLLGDPDFPGDQRPEDPNDDAAWVVFFEDVVREFIASRYPLAENASAEERAAVEDLVTRELQAVIAFYAAVRERERSMLAGEEASGQDAGSLPSETGDERKGDQPSGDQPAADSQAPSASLPAAGSDVPGSGPLTIGHVGEPWSRGGMGVEPRGWRVGGDAWPVTFTPAG